MLNRRNFLKGGISIALAGTITQLGLVDSIFAAGVRDVSAHDPVTNRTLIIIQLKGGNDGLNTVIPYGNGHYYDARPQLAIPPEKVLGLTNEVGLHPSLTAIKSLWDDGHLAIIQGVGYPDQNFSHFQSQHVWKTANPSARKSEGGDGWIGRQLANMPRKDTDWFKGISLGKTYPISPMATAELALPAIKNLENYQILGQLDSSFSDLNELETLKSLYEQYSFLTSHRKRLNDTLETALSTSASLRSAYNNYVPRSHYPEGNFPQELKLLASAITQGLGVRVAHLTISGFDTHADELTRQSNLLQQFSEGIKAFYDDLRQHELDHQVIIMTWSEFGRRVPMNGSLGTDHGAASPVFVLGTPILGGFFGDHPDLRSLDNGNLKFTTDFRSVYRTVLEDWLGGSNEIIMEQQHYDLLPILDV